MYRNLQPFYPEKLIVVLEIGPILDATEFAVAIIVQYRGDFCRPRIGIVEVPVLSVTLVTGSSIKDRGKH